MYGKRTKEEEYWDQFKMNQLPTVKGQPMSGGEAIDGNKFSIHKDPSAMTLKSSIPQQGGGDSFSSFMSGVGVALGGVNPYIAGASALSDISKEKKKQEAQRKKAQMGALESYLNVAKQMGEGLYRGGVN